MGWFNNCADSGQMMTMIHGSVVNCLPTILRCRVKVEANSTKGHQPTLHLPLLIAHLR